MKTQADKLIATNLTVIETAENIKHSCEDILFTTGQFLTEKDRWDLRKQIADAQRIISNSKKIQNDLMSINEVKQTLN